MDLGVQDLADSRSQTTFFAVANTSMPAASIVFDDLQFLDFTVNIRNHPFSPSLCNDLLHDKP